MLLLNGLSRTRVFLIFAVLLSSIISYISCLQSVETGSYYWVLPILFMAYVSIIMGIKTEGAFKAFSIGLVVFVFQFIIFTLIFLMLVFSAIGGFQSTTDTDGTTNLLIDHFEEDVSFDSVKSINLLRIYAKYPTKNLWFKGMKRTITDNYIRNIYLKIGFAFLVLISIIIIGV